MLKSVDIRTSDLHIIQKILHPLLPEHSRVWVFGSRAKGTTKRSSDLDLAIDAGRALTDRENTLLLDEFEIRPTL